MISGNSFAGTQAPAASLKAKHSKAKHSKANHTKATTSRRPHQGNHTKTNHTKADPTKGRPHQGRPHQKQNTPRHCAQSNGRLACSCSQVQHTTIHVLDSYLCHSMSDCCYPSSLARAVLHHLHLPCWHGYVCLNSHVVVGISYVVVALSLCASQLQNQELCATLWGCNSMGA